jgi:hypothetical protein
MDPGVPVVVGSKPVDLTPGELDSLRVLAVDLLVWACDGGDVSEKHPRYVQVTEGRDKGPGYSSCADLAHWLFYRLGVRSSWVNRFEHNGWRSGVNIARLVTAAVKYGGLADYPPGSIDGRWLIRCGGEARADPGDVVIVANDWPGGRDSHAVCIRAQRPEGGYLTAEYGLPGGGLRERPRFGRRIRAWLPLDRILTEAFNRGELVSPDLPEGFS